MLRSISTLSSWSIQGSNGRKKAITMNDLPMKEVGMKLLHIDGKKTEKRSMKKAIGEGQAKKPRSKGTHCVRLYHHRQTQVF